jgi:hypothetical protein
MATPIRIKRSSVPTKKPTNNDLLFGELGLNTFDGRLFLKQDQGKLGVGPRVIEVGAGARIGRTIFVTATGDDGNTGLNEVDSKASIKAAAAIALPGDTIKVYPGVYVEDNPIVLARTVSVEGTELRNCVITPGNPDRDLFYVNNGCHITDASFIGPEMSNGAAIVSLQPLLGVATDRFFDAARMIRYNLDYIAKESVGFLTSGFSGLAGNHREQDAARLIESNLNYIAAEAVGFLTSTSPGLNFTLNGSNYTNCKEDIVSVFSAVAYDLKANSNRKSVGAGLSYFNSSGGLIHITGIATQQATIAAMNYASLIASLFVINNQTTPFSFQGIGNSIAQVKNPSVIAVPGGCVGVGTTIRQLVGIITSMIGAGSTLVAPAIRYGVKLESNDCADDIKDIWKCIIHDITRGGNSRSVDAGSAYYDKNNNLIPQILKNPGEIAQTVATVDYSFNIARSIVNNCTWGGYPVGLGTTVVTASYSATTGVTTITATNHGLLKDDAVKIVGLGFTCPSGLGTLTYPTGSLGYIFNVKSVVGVNTFEVVVGQSTLPHTYVSGGTVQKYTNFQNETTQLKDLAIQTDPDTGFNNAINGCANVVSAIRSCVGVVTSIVANSPSIVGVKFNKTYPGNRGLGFGNVVGVTSAVYNERTGNLLVEAPGLFVNNPLKLGDVVELRNLLFKCSSGGSISTQAFPSGAYGYEFAVNKLNSDNSFVVTVGPSTIPHTYVSGGYIVDRSIGIQTAQYNNVTGITTITAPGISLRTGDIITLRNLKFSCASGAGTTTIYPTGNNGYDFRVLSVVGSGTTFTVNVGTSTIPHTYVSGGSVRPPYSKGVGPITQGPYIRNCTNFVPKSIGMKVDGFNAEPGDKDDIGVTGTMSVDSYTQYNQGGIGVSITNGAYAQLVSIFTICDDIAIYTASGGQCDLTNSNSSFGNYGLYASGVGDQTSKSIYRYTGIAHTTSVIDSDVLVVSGLGNQRPYDGQAMYFGQLYYFVKSIKVTHGGSGYTTPPRVVIDFPVGPQGVRAEGSSNIDSSGSVTSIDIIADGSQYTGIPNITIAPPNVGIDTATAQIEIFPIYYSIESATAPSAGISTIVLNQRLNNTVGAGTTIYFSRVSLEIATTISFEWVGAGTNINTAKPALGGVTIPDNEVVEEGGGQVVYTSTNQAGNFRIGDGLVANQLTGTISGRSFDQSIINKVTPLIIALDS